MSTTLADLLHQFRTDATSDADKGSKFERLTKFYLIFDPIWSEQLTNVRLGREAGIGPDVGIDLVAEDVATGGKVAIQCKFYDEKTYLQDLGTFLTASGKEGYVRRVLITTSDRWTKNAGDALKNQQVPVQRIMLHDMEQSQIDWGSFDLAANYGSVPITKKELRPHQVDALKSVMEGFKDADRGKMIMACGTGKTLTSLRIAEEFFAKKKTPSTILFLAPSISLLGQTILEWGQNRKSSYMALAVCSDSKVGKNDEDMLPTDLAIPASTDVGKLTSALSYRGKKNLVIFSTYQSLEIISKAQKAKKNPLSGIDLVICDEAHRTTGVTQAARAAADDFSHFVRIHDEDYVHARKRLYMTATPKIYKDVEGKVADSGGVIASMDDEDKFGPEFYRLGFAHAVERGLLSDYRVLILAVDEEYVARGDLERFRSEDSTINLDEASKLLGCWRGLSKIKTVGEDVDNAPMKRAVAFANTIEASKSLAARLEIIGRTATRPSEGNQGLILNTQHVDGKQNAQVRRQRLDWLKAEPGPGTARILTNARCLSEGIDVPALDAVIFTEARGSQVDIVQAVGRVMRRHEGKSSGYIILPVAITSGADINTTLKQTKYKVIWDVLNALRAHDDRFDVIVNSIDLNQNRDSKIEIEVVSGDEGANLPTPEEFEQGILVHLPTQIADGIYAKIVEKVGERDYWEKWANDIADIAKSQEIRINALLQNANGKPAKEFAKFLKGIRESLNDSITREDAIEMLAQHLITKPVFDALFKDYGFAENNPVSQTMDGVLKVLNDHIETDGKLDQFYEGVRHRVEGIDNNASRQKLITELYERFFKIAFPRTTKKLGIVYTPVEIVDFILRSVEHVLHHEFEASLSDKGVHILDPFTGTGTFITRLLQSNLIKKIDLHDKYHSEIHANEIVLLAYYIAAINIESTFAELTDGDYAAFDGMVLADTFQMFETEDELDIDVFVANSERAEIQKSKDIRVIVGNPPYSVGQGDANDDNKNFVYPDLDESIRKTYVKNSSTTTLKSMYDSYIRAFRWASNRIQDQGIVSFVTNGSFIDSKAADGFRKSLCDEFTNVYIFNLRGDARTKGEPRRREGGNVFGEGSRTPIAITLLARNPRSKIPGKIHYFDIGDYLTREAKLEKIKSIGDIGHVPWDVITPNEHGDWINQRTGLYGTFLPLGDKKRKGKEGQSIFIDFSQGMVTAKDTWCYNYSKDELKTNITTLISNYEAFLSKWSKGAISLEEITKLPKSEISWSRGVLTRFEKKEHIQFEPEDIQHTQYRPFVKSWGYRSPKVIEVQYRTRSLFPNDSKNIAIGTSGISSSSFSVLALSNLFDFHFLTGDAYPLYFFEDDSDRTQQSFDFDEERVMVQRDGISDWALRTFHGIYADNKITKKDIFNYTYGVLGSPEFEARFAQDARKAGPRLPLVKDFWGFARAGKSLFKLHSEYEILEPYKHLEIEITGGVKDPKVLYKVEKMRFARGVSPDVDRVKSTLIFNEFITIRNIPTKVHEYKVNGRSPLEWIVDQYKVYKDKDTGILNDPNTYSDDPKYIYDLVLRVLTLSMETQKIFEGLPKLELI